MEQLDNLQLVDLHVHSSASDGTLSPASLVSYVKEHGGYGFALTDHDTIAGLEPAMAEASHLGVHIIPGIEISTGYKGGDVHILGLFVNKDKESFKNAVSALQEARISRNRRMIQKMADFGFDISEDKMKDRFGDTSLTRAHYGRYLMEHGYVSSIKEAFDRYLKRGCPCYVKKDEITIYDAMTILKDAEAIPVLAHPMLYHFLSSDELRELISDLKSQGLIGIEAIYSENSPEEEAMTRQLAHEFDLAITGGSDFHGSNKPYIEILSGKGNLSITSNLIDSLIDGAKKAGNSYEHYHY